MASPPCRRRDRRSPGVGLAALLPALLLAVIVLLAVPAAWAAPGLCLGPVCADAIQRSPQHPWQLRLRVDDQLGHRERITVDCRDVRISPLEGPVERGHVEALMRRACRLAGQAPA